MTPRFPIPMGEPDDDSVIEDEIDQEDIDEAVNVDNWKCPKCGSRLLLIKGEFQMGEIGSEVISHLICETGKKLCWETIVHIRTNSKRNPVRYKRMKEIFSKALSEI